MSAEQHADPVTPTPRRRVARAPRPEGTGGWPRAVIAIVFAAFHGYVVWEAVTNLRELPPIWNPVTGAPVPWWVLIASLAVPVIAFAAASIVNRRMPWFRQAVVYLAALGVTNCLFLAGVALVSRIATG